MKGEASAATRAQQLQATKAACNVARSNAGPKAAAEQALVPPQPLLQSTAKE
jgi:hypothetical protein